MRHPGTSRCVTRCAGRCRSSPAVACKGVMPVTTLERLFAEASCRSWSRIRYPQRLLLRSAKKWLFEHELHPAATMLYEVAPASSINELASTSLSPTSSFDFRAFQSQSYSVMSFLWLTRPPPLTCFARNAQHRSTLAVLLSRILTP